jgi:hypothetical protein
MPSGLVIDKALNDPVPVAVKFVNVAELAVVEPIIPGISQV